MTEEEMRAAKVVGAILYCVVAVMFTIVGFLLGVAYG